MIYFDGRHSIRVYAARGAKREYYHPAVTGFSPDLIQVKIKHFSGEFVWINIRKKQLIRRSAAGIPNEFVFNSRLAFCPVPDKDAIKRIIAVVSAS